MPTPERPTEAEGAIRIGISSCLIGEKVRFDGGHKHDRFLTGTVGRFVEFVPVCPEMEIGLGTPRETLRLVAGQDGTRLLAPRSGSDHTATMRRFARRRSRELAAAELSGFILKKDSPSCGMERVRVYSEKGMPTRQGRGLFAEHLMEAFPLLPIEEEGRLNDPRLRENFFERVFAYRRLCDLFGTRWSRGQVVGFHTAEKFLLMAHDAQAYRALGRLVADIKQTPRSTFAASYQEAYMHGLRRIATARKHANVLQHMAGFLRDHLEHEDRAELSELIHDFRMGLVPLVVPVTLVRHHARRFQVEYLLGQRYLEPHPKELMLRNHV